MDEQERKMLEEVLKLSQDNNAMVRKLVAYNRRSTVWRIIYWTIIIGSTIAAYYSIQPYIGMITKFFTGHDFSKLLDNFNALPKN